MTKRLFAFLLTTLALVNVASCASVPSTDTDGAGSSHEATIDSADAQPGLPSTILPDAYNITAERPFEALSVEDVTQARAIFPLVSSYTLNDDETAQLVAALVDAEVVSTNNDGSCSDVWFELDFVSGESWLLKGTTGAFSGTMTLTVGSGTLGLDHGTQEQLVDLFGRCESSLEQEGEYVIPFEGLEDSSLERVEYSPDQSMWLEMTDEDSVDGLVGILAGIKVNVASGTRDYPSYYGDGGGIHLFRLTYKDGSVVTVGSFDTVTCIGGINYASKDNGLLSFYESL